MQAWGAEPPAKEDRFVAYSEVDSQADEQEIETAANAGTHWVHRNGVPAGASTVLEDALRAATFPEGLCYARAGGEANTLKSIRRYLLRERGFDPSLTSFSGHWKLGVSGHDHHEPIENERVVKPGPGDIARSRFCLPALLMPDGIQWPEAALQRARSLVRRGVADHRDADREVLLRNTQQFLDLLLLPHPDEGRARAPR